MIKKAILLKVGDFDLVEIHLGKEPLGVVRGKSQVGELELRIPLTFHFRSHREKEPRLEEILSEVKTSVAKLCLDTAWKLNQQSVIQKVKAHERIQQIKKPAS